MKMTSELTNADLQGNFMSNTDCPMARSLNRVVRMVYGDDFRVAVGGYVFHIYTGAPYISEEYDTERHPIPMVEWKKLGLFPRTAKWDCITHAQLKNRWFKTRVTYTVVLPL